MENLRIFESPEFGQVRTKLDDKGMSWFVGKDIAEALGYNNTRDALSRHVDCEDKTTVGIHDGGSNYKTQAVIINESGLYALIFGSKLQKAREFKHWVTSVVLPQIRKTGGFIPLHDGDTEEEITARTIEVMKKTIAEKENLLEAQKSDVMFSKAIQACDNDILIGDLAKLITENGYPIGQKRLFYWLRLHHYLFQHETLPLQRWVERGLFRIDASVIQTRYGNLENITTRVTGRGQKYFINGFKTGKFHASDKALQPKEYDLFYSCMKNK